MCESASFAETIHAAVRAAATAAKALSPEERAFEAADESFQIFDPDLIYGELLVGSFVATLLERAAASRGGSIRQFLDIGSGEGSLVAAAALSGLCRASTGIELVPRLHRAGCRTLRALSAHRAASCATSSASAVPDAGSTAPLAERRGVPIALVNADMFDPVPSALTVALPPADADVVDVGAVCGSQQVYLRSLHPVVPTKRPSTDTLESSSIDVSAPSAGGQKGLGCSACSGCSGCADVVLVNGLCFEPETMTRCLDMLLQPASGKAVCDGSSAPCGCSSGGAASASSPPRWHVCASGGLLLLTSIELPGICGHCRSGKTVDGTSKEPPHGSLCSCTYSGVAEAWSITCDTSWGRPVTVRAYVRG